MLEQAAAIRNREISPVEVTEHYLRRIHLMNDQVGAYYTVASEMALDQARAAAKLVTGSNGDLPPLTGVPIPIKDLNMLAGVRQTLGSLVYEDNIPDTDDYVGAALKASGATMIGKTATP